MEYLNVIHVEAGQFIDTETQWLCVEGIQSVIEHVKKKLPDADMVVVTFPELKTE